MTWLVTLTEKGRNREAYVNAESPLTAIGTAAREWLPVKDVVVITAELLDRPDGCVVRLRWS